MNERSEKDVFLSQQAEQDFLGAFKRAIESGQWMAAVWRVQDGKVELVGRSTFAFPRDDFLPSVGMLAMTCHEDNQKARGILPPEPLPKADFHGLRGILGRRILSRKEGNGDAGAPKVIPMDEEKLDEAVTDDGVSGDER